MGWDAKGHRADHGRATIEYELPLKLTDGTVLVYTRCSRLGNRSYDMEHVIARQKDGQVAATGLIALVVYDYRAGRSAALPDEWRARITAYEPRLGLLSSPPNPLST